MRTVALDLGGRKTALSEVVAGKVEVRATVRKWSALERWLGANTPPARVAFEAGRASWAMADWLVARGHTPVLVDTTRVKEMGIGRHGRKTDRIDADVLARALAEERIPEANQLGAEHQEIRRHLEVRRILVMQRAHLATTIRGLLQSYGIKLKSVRVEALPRVLEEAELGESVRSVIAPLATLLPALNERIETAEARLVELASREPVVERLMTVIGVSLITALAFVSVVDSPQRFKNAHKVNSYLGLVPSEHSSGGRGHRLGAITKKGNGYLRMCLVQGAHVVLRSRRADDPLVQGGQALAKRRSKKIAAVAVARRLSSILWAIWRDGTTYDPAMLADASARGHEDETERQAREADALRWAAQKLRRYRRAA